jgi:predicted esterase YcpF (UPF0227 family)
MRPVIYVHGYGSTGNTETAKNLRATFVGDFDVISPTYDCSNPRAARDQLTSLVESLKQDKPIIVGTSLGGFFANLVARLCDIPVIAVNPSTQPSGSLHKYGENAEALAGYQELEEQERSQETLPRRIVILGSRDDVVNPHTNGARLTGNTETVWLDMGHRIEPVFYGTIANFVRKLA